MSIGGTDHSTGTINTFPALDMVASRPRIDEIVTGGDSLSNDVGVGKTNRKNGRHQQRRPPANRAKTSRRRRNHHHHQQRHRNSSGGNLPLLSEDDDAYSIHEEMGMPLRQFDDIRSNFQSPVGNVQAGAVNEGMGVLAQAELVLDGFLNHAVNEDNYTQLNEWILYYATKIVRCYLHLERQMWDIQSSRSGPSRQQVVCESNDPLHRAAVLLKRLERHFCTSSSGNNGSNANNLLKWMETAAALVPSSYLREQVYNNLIGAYTKRAKLCSSGNGNRSSASLAEGYISTAESILERMADADSSLVPPDTKSYGLVLSAYARGGNADAASDLLTRMEGRYDNGNYPPGPRPNVICYNAALNAYARAARPHDAMELLNRMTDRGIQADVVSYTSVLDCWARWLQSASPKNANDSANVMEAMAGAEDIMAKLESTGGGPNVVAYNALLKVYLNLAKLLGKVNTKSSADDPNSNVISSSEPLVQLAENALSVFNRMSRSKVYPNFITYSCAIHACAAAADSIASRKRTSGWQKHALDAAKLSQKILMTMERSFVTSGDARFAPPVKLYNMAVTALGRCRLEEGITEAQALIHHIEEDADLGTESLPNTVTYTAYMKALADMCCPSAAKRAEEVLTKMEKSYRNGSAAVKPTLLSYNTSLQAWAKIQNRIGAERADRVLSQMEAKHNAGKSNICPDLYSYSICIDAWAKSKDRSAGERAESIFGRMLRKPACLSPNLVVYNALINAWGASQDPRAGKKAMKILDEMEQCAGVNPDRVSYSSVIDAWAKSEAEDAASMSEAVLNRMEGLGSTKPSVVTYNCILNALATSDDADSASRAEAILNRMEGADIISFNTAIKAWARSPSSDKAARARDILDRMLESKSRPNPDLVTFNTVLNACAASNESRVEAFQIAMDTFGVLQRSKHLRPNEYTYGTLIKACATLLPQGQERVELVEQLYKRCCDNDCLSEPVVRILRSSLSEDDYVHILGDSY